MYSRVGQMKEIASALCYLHSKSIVYGDLKEVRKPPNSHRGTRLLTRIKIGQRSDRPQPTRQAHRLWTQYEDGRRAEDPIVHGSHPVPSPRSRRSQSQIGQERYLRFWALDARGEPAELLYFVAVAYMTTYAERLLSGGWLTMNKKRTTSPLPMRTTFQIYGPNITQSSDRAGRMCCGR